MKEICFPINVLDMKPEIYLRYRNNVFAIFEDQDSCSKFLEILN